MGGVFAAQYLLQSLFSSIQQREGLVTSKAHVSNVAGLSQLIFNINEIEVNERLYVHIPSTLMAEATDLIFQWSAISVKLR